MHWQLASHADESIHRLTDVPQQTYLYGTDHFPPPGPPEGGAQFQFRQPPPVWSTLSPPFQPFFFLIRGAQGVSCQLILAPGLPGGGNNNPLKGPQQPHLAVFTAFSSCPCPRPRLLLLVPQVVVTPQVVVMVVIFSPPHPLSPP